MAGEWRRRPPAEPAPLTQAITHGTFFFVPAPADAIPVIDLFAGPGGLAEGFAAATDARGRPLFRIALSIEKDPFARKTLGLRAFYRQFRRGSAPADYYDYLRQQITRQELMDRHPRQAEAANAEAWNATLGDVDPAEVSGRIDRALGGAPTWAMIGGPPCQAYSLVGRSRVGGIHAGDPRVYLYREYLRLIARHAPAVFVMENVKGLLSSKVNDQQVFEMMRRDLQEPGAAVRRLQRRGIEFLQDVRYRLRSFVAPTPATDLIGQSTLNPAEFVICCERYGIPQARHRVIILGIREDIDETVLVPLTPKDPVTVEMALRDLPSLRSGLSRDGEDSSRRWAARVREFFGQVPVKSVIEHGGGEVFDAIREVIGKIGSTGLGDVSRGAAFVPWELDGCLDPDWYKSGRAFGGYCNHETRQHIAPDLHRYLYAACFASHHGRSPGLKNFPVELLPSHRSAELALEGHGWFSDRFRVQVSGKPSTTITSHIAKDGHYYIHYDPLQCRSLTVREAARLQTFPDDYLFEGPRTEQYKQVGNAVPPRLAVQLATRVASLLG